MSGILGKPSLSSKIESACKFLSSVNGIPGCFRSRLLLAVADYL